MVPAILTERSQCSCISHCKFAFLCIYISGEVEHSVCPSPVPCQRGILCSLPELTKFLRLKQSFKPWTLENSSKQMAPCFPDDTSDRTACPPFSDLPLHVIIMNILLIVPLHSQFEVVVEVSWHLEPSVPKSSSFPEDLALHMSVNWPHPNHEPKFSPFHPHREAPTYRKITFKKYRF